MLPFIIHENQGGFVKGRFIGENIKLIGDIIYLQYKYDHIFHFS